MVCEGCGCWSCPCCGVGLRRQHGLPDDAELPHVCASWEEYHDRLKVHFTPVEYGPKGQPVFDLAETEMVFLPPKDWSE